jgi:class 3 adenylate cyclase
MSSDAKPTTTMLGYLHRCGIKQVTTYTDGAIVNPVRFPLAAVETDGAVLFADLPGFSRLSAEIGPVDAAYYASHFFAWFEGEGGRRFGGIVDKFIGDEVMMVFPRGTCQVSPLEAALLTARAMLSLDPYAFCPKFGVAAGPFAIAVVGTETTQCVSAFGNTVNLAARCAATTSGGQQIRVAAGDRELIDRLFSDQVNTWEVTGPTEFRPHNMTSVQVIDIVHKPFWLPNFDFLAEVRQMVQYARDHGAVYADTGLAGDSGGAAREDAPGAA